MRYDRRPAWSRDEQVRKARPGVSRGRFERQATLDDGDDCIVAEAVASAKDGDGDALRYLYVRYADNVYGYVRSIVRDEHEAEDVTQQVFAKLMTMIARYEDRGLPFSAWILRVARNLAVDHLRSQRMIPCDDVRGNEVHTEHEHHERSKALIDALSSLPDEQRHTLYLRHVLGLSPGEVGDLVGKSEASVHGLHHRGRRALQEALRERDAAPAVRLDSGLALAAV